jgi:NADH:ubiquinone oxidoreductase subunit K
MIPPSHLLLLALIQFLLGLAGLLLRRGGGAVILSALVMTNGVLMALGCQWISAGVLILGLLLVFALVGAAILFSFYKFQRVVNVEEQDRLKD